MKVGFLPHAMWMAFARSFRKGLVSVLHEPEPSDVMRKARKEYRAILHGVDTFDKDDRFIINILSCAMFAAVLRHICKPCDVETARQYYEAAMNNAVMCFTIARENTYTAKGQAAMRRRAERSQQIQNPYSWRFTYEAGATVNQYTATFSTCGICRLMRELELEQYTPALCAYDYPMNAMAHTVFTRQYTLASGGPCCDCHYDHQARSHSQHGKATQS